MTIFCPNALTLVSINGGDYTKYPPGTDVEVLPVTLNYSFLWAATRWRGYVDCSGWTNYLRYRNKNNAVGTISSWESTHLGAATMIQRLGEKWIIDNCKPLDYGETGFSFVLGDFYPICSGSESQVSVRYNQIEQFKAGQEANAVYSTSVSAYRLKITIPED